MLNMENAKSEERKPFLKGRISNMDSNAIATYLIISIWYAIARTVFRKRPSGQK